MTCWIITRARILAYAIWQATGAACPCHDFMRNKVGGSRRNLMLKCANLDASAGFRETYQYNNHMYIVLGYLMEVLRGGESWESQIKRRIADPLGVETIRFRGLPGNMDNLERALPYVSDGYAAHRCSYSDSPLSGPCGGIKVNVKDLSKWVMAMARGGVCESGERLCSAAQYAAMTSPLYHPPRRTWIPPRLLLRTWLAHGRIQRARHSVPQRRA